MRKEEYESLPKFLWVKNPKNLVVEVAKETVFEFINGRYEFKKGFSLAKEQEAIKKAQISPNIPQLNERDYLNVEEL